jgi:hypothetical protein
VCCARARTEAALAAHGCRPSRLFDSPAVLRAFPEAAGGARRLEFRGGDDSGSSDADARS